MYKQCEFRKWGVSAALPCGRPYLSNVTSDVTEIGCCCTAVFVRLFHPGGLLLQDGCHLFELSAGGPHQQETDLRISATVNNAFTITLLIPALIPRSTGGSTKPDLSPVRGYMPRYKPCFLTYNSIEYI